MLSISEKQKTVSLRGHTNKMHVLRYTSKIFWSLSSTTHALVYPYTSLYTPSPYPVNQILHIFLAYLDLSPLLCPSLPRLRSHSQYSPLCCGVAMNQVCEMEMRTLSLAHSQPPSSTRHLNEAMPPMFFSDLGVLPNRISGAEREREREWGGDREWAECRGRRGGAAQKDERREDEKWTRERGNVEMRTKHGTDPRAFGLFLIL